MLARIGTILGSIRGQLTLSFVVIGIAPLLLVLWLAHDMASDGIERLAADRLAVIAQERAKAIERIAAEHVRGVDAIVFAPGFVAAARNCAKPVAENDDFAQAEVESARLRAYRFLAPFADAYGFRDVLLISPQGRVMFSLAKPAAIGTSLNDASWKGSSLVTAFAEVSTLVQSQVTPSRPGDPGARNDIWAVGPLLEDNTLVGIIAGEIVPDVFVDVLADRSQLGTTGEVIAAARVDDSHFLLTSPTRHDSSAAFRGRVGVSDPLGERLKRAAEGSEGEGFSAGDDGSDVVAAWTYAPSLRWSITAEQDVQEAFAPVAKLRDAAAIAVAGVFVSVVGFALGLARRIARPLGQAASASRRMAQGDLTSPVEVRGRGETRELLAAVRQTNLDLAALLGRIRASTNSIAAASGNVRRVAQGQQETSRDFGASSAQIAAATNEMSATSRELAATVTQLSRTAAVAAQAAGEGRGALHGLTESMERLDAGSSGVASRFAALSQKAAQIDAVVAAITKVANQTNLLAVNAGIEAEKAGEVGLGFQVVAREIDRLATQAATSALEIEAMVASMQEAVAQGVRELGQFAHTVDAGCTTARGANERLSQVLRQVEELQVSFEHVAQAVRSQSEGVSQVNDAMATLTQGARRTSDAASASARSSEDLDLAAKGLEEEVARFRLP
ncbi:MAG: methyl-accepting chemotaxis protein [Phycisphaerales bacterium]